MMQHEVVHTSEDSEKAVRRDRMVNWMTDLLGEYFKHILAKRVNTPSLNETCSGDIDLTSDLIAINEVVEAIQLPQFDAESDIHVLDWQAVEIDETVHEQMRDFVSIIASMY